jgi:hypothetical protein
MPIVKHPARIALSRTGAVLIVFFILSQCSASPANIIDAESNTDTEILTAVEDETEQTEAQDDPIIVPARNDALPVTSFGEVWAYVVAGREAALTRNLPLTDIGYFSAEIDSYGALVGVPRRQNISFPGRVHLVVICDSRSLTHFVLVEGSGERRKLVSDLLTAARSFDGLQIDFENVPARDGEAFLSFLRELRVGLQGKLFTIALPARTRRIADDVYDYEKIKPYVDRILVMAYDEHWSGSAPGSIASLQWCRNVADYSLRVIGREKLVMGMPFYGRAWGDYSPSRALIYSTIEGIIKETGVNEIRRENGIPMFNYSVNVSIKVYYEDEFSLSTRMEMYKSMNVRSIGFWRLGQETPKVWNYLKLEG